ncbi:MAG: hypothetical protein AABW73_03525 [Nanoarchaeota archaeon]
MNNKTMVHVIPTIFSTSKEEFFKKFKKLVKVSKHLQIDFMDGKFVKGKSVSLAVIPNLTKLSNVFEAHLMVEKPQTWINKLKDKGFKKIIFHYESIKDKGEILSLIEKIKFSGMKVFLAVSPSTSVLNVGLFVPFVDGFLLMGVNPGLERQSLISSTYDRIKTLRNFDRDVVIQIDGGINLFTAKKLANAGVNIINSGSLVNASDNPKKTIKELESYFK